MTTKSAAKAPRMSLGQRKGPAERPLIEPPTFSPGVELHRPPTEGESWFLRRGTHQYFKLTGDLARLADLVDGSRTREVILQDLGEPWTAADVDQAIRSLGDAHVLRAEGEKTRPRQEVVRFVPPLTVQLTLFNPSRILCHVASWIPFARTPASVIAAAAVALGILSLVVRPAQVMTALSSPVPYATVFGIFLGTLAATALHEFGHGLVLASYGGRPRRIGVMLFYLMPAFFCDVSDGWRLPQSRQRVHVALAGILVQGTIGSAAALASLLPFSPDAKAGLTVFAIVTLLACLMNTIPFVKLDGYIALMSWVDITHLRDKSMADARGVLARVFFGRRPPRQLPRLPWAIPFGFACLLFPVFLVVNALLIWFDTMQRLGVLGSMLILGLIAVAIFGLGKEIAKSVSEAREAGASGVRMGIVVLVVSVVASAALAFLPMPQSMAGGFLRASDSTELVLPTSSDASQLEPGTVVELRTSGIALSTPIGRAIVGEGDPIDEMRPFSTLFPVKEDLLMIPTTTLPLIDVESGGASQGAASIRVDDQPLWRWLVALVANGL
ncbi:daptide biosynthesis intramembrane metalloprotease [Cryobacterium sp. Y50]|uniref:daptide biosynthesis intramembrane metalloprotease n=1 Tax=Cryobacterium sp. Y50 TaxID=2048286 RepID=UPI000CE38217|nr:daptide biosynthesis intramembrane metalloprotease [Cryobacterium sp. Y50]